MKKHTLQKQPRTPRTYCVYAVLLDSAAWGSNRFKKKNKDCDRNLPCYYVGSSSLGAQERFKKHKTGAPSKKGHKNHNNLTMNLGLRVVDTLVESGFTSREEAELREEALGKELRAKGHGTWWGVRKMGNTGNASNKVS